MLEINLQKIKFWAILSIIQVGCFGLGLYTGRNIWPIKQSKTIQIDYTTKSALEQTPTTTMDNGGECPIKGSKSKTYHIPSGAFYDRTTPEQCFTTEAEAEAAGFTKSSR